MSHNHFQCYLTTAGVLSQKKKICGPTEINNFHTFLEMKDAGKPISNSFVKNNKRF